MKTGAGVVLNRSYPPGQLKVITEQKEETDLYEVEKIVDHRKTAGGIMEYQVKWKGYGDCDNTWETEDNFLQTQCIDEYWSKLDSVTEDSDQTKRADLSRKRRPARPVTPFLCVSDRGDDNKAGRSTRAMWSMSHFLESQRTNEKFSVPRGLKV